MEKKVIELFAGVGGFRVGLNEISGFDENGKAIEKNNFDFVWANQWEPSTKTQHAFECYQTRFGKSASENINEDIALIDKKTIPNHALLCGGFPCQDYSVAHSLSKEKGIEGKKGVLWWQINAILKTKKTPFVLLENVDRLIKSPAKQRGRDFGVMLRCFADLGYAVEWRVINAADYGHPQRRRRIYIFAYHKSTKYYKRMSKLSAKKVIQNEGLFALKFPVELEQNEPKKINIKKEYKDLVDISNEFKASFDNSGYMYNGNVYTMKTTPVLEKPTFLSELIQTNVDASFFLTKEKVSKFEYLRGNKRILRTRPNGKPYYYSEGAMSPVDSLDLPGRTMLTSEGSTNRSTHIIVDPSNNKIRLLTPVECERLQQFPDDWTNTMPTKRRYFMMGNALVCGVIKKLGNEIEKIIERE